MDRKKEKQWEIAQLLKEQDPPSYQEGDLLMFNTLADNSLPSTYVNNYHIHILCRTGTAQFRMGDKSFKIEPGDFVIWQLGSQIYDTLYSPDFEADFLLVSRIFLIENNPEKIWATKGYVYIKQNPVFHPDGKGYKLIESDFRRFREQLTDREHLFCREILGKLLQIFLFNLWNIYADEIRRQLQISNLRANLFHRFMDLIRQYAMVDREVNFYSERLCVTPKYLSEVVRDGSGYPASYWINGYATQEIISMLKNPELTFNEISDRMHFYNQAHFSRYVKKMLGMSPTEYRNELERKETGK